MASEVASDDDAVETNVEIRTENNPEIVDDETNTVSENGNERPGLKFSTDVAAWWV